MELQHDLSPSEWIRPRLRRWGVREGTPVTSLVPTGFAAYVRVLHPAESSRGDAVRWREVAAWSQRTYHPLMQFDRIRVPLEPAIGPPLFDQEPDVGRLSGTLCAALYEVLSAWTSTPDTSWAGIWDGFGQLHDAAVRESVSRAPRFSHPHRDYLLARVPPGAICRFQDSPWSLTPSLAWPDDRSWCVATEIDFDSTLVACGEDCAAALLADDRIEALRVPPDGRLDIEGDLLNR